MSQEYLSGAQNVLSGASAISSESLLRLSNPHGSERLEQPATTYNIICGPELWFCLRSYIDSDLVRIALHSDTPSLGELIFLTSKILKTLYEGGGTATSL